MILSLRSINASTDVWLRMHTPPKVCRIPEDDWTAKEQVYYQRSLDRYWLTDDGMEIAALGRSLIREIGRCENVRFIES